MASHIRLGQNGEQMAAAFLEWKGFTILHRNWRFAQYEIDIIAEKEGILHIVEVKIRSSQNFGFPEESVTRKKFHSLVRAADEFLHRNPCYRHVQYDIVAIRMFPKQPTEYFLIEDVFFNEK